MNRKTTIIISLLIYFTNLTLFNTNTISYLIIITILFGLNVLTYIGYNKETKIKSSDLESLISDIMESYKTNKNRKSSPKLCGECRKDKTEGYTHCYECQTCILNRDHHCVWLDSCVNKKNWGFFNGMIFLQTLLCSNGIIRSFNNIFKGNNFFLEIWYLLVFGFNLLIGLFMGFILINSFISLIIQKNNIPKLKKNELNELEKKVGHGFSRVTVI